MLICQNKSNKLNQECLLLPSSLPSVYTPYWMAVVTEYQNAKYQNAKSQINLLEAACPWGNFIFLSQFPLQIRESQYFSIS